MAPTHAPTLSPPYALDEWVDRSLDGQLLTGGAPARLLRLSPAGAAALDALLAGEQKTPGVRRLLPRLRSAGLIHPIANPGAVIDVDVTTIVPVRDGGPDLGLLVSELRRFGEVIVVDDGSRDASSRWAGNAGARVEKNRGAPGPAGARNTGLALAGTEFVAFVDADCRSDSNWVAQMATLLSEDPTLAVAAPRVRAHLAPGAIALYETGSSPLDMGPHRSLVGPGRRVGFVPSAAFVARRSALLGIGGFDESRRFGEDVDLVLRLLSRGWSVRYAPEAALRHRCRETLPELMRQRFEYARSAAALDRAHPGAVAPLRANAQSLAIWLGLAAGPKLGAAAIAGSVAVATTRGSDWTAKRALARLAARSGWESSRSAARFLSRDALPLTVSACLISPRARRVAALAIAADVLCSRHPDAQPQGLAARAILRQADNVAYATGLWSGALRSRSARGLLPQWVGTSAREVRGPAPE